MPLTMPLTNPGSHKRALRRKNNWLSGPALVLFIIMHVTCADLGARKRLTRGREATPVELDVWIDIASKARRGHTPHTTNPLHTLLTFSSVKHGARARDRQIPAHR